MSRCIQSQQIRDTKIAVYNTGKRQYQIVTTKGSNVKVLNFEGEYNSAICEFIMKAREINNKMA